MDIKVWFFVEIMFEKHGQGTHSNKMGPDKLTENASNAKKFISQNCLLKSKGLRFQWKKASLRVHSPCMLLRKYVIMYILV